MQLRPYQQAAIESVYHHLRTRDDNPCVVLPTASGKSPTMAAICRDAVQLWRGRVLILAHVKELLEQTADKLHRICPHLNVGLYSAGLNRRETQANVIVAGIQSVHSRACELDAFDLVLVDECHLLPPEGDGMYRRFLAEAKIVNPSIRLVGFTATPFRLKSGTICTPDGFLNHVCYEVGIRELIRDGYLCPLVTKSGINKADFDRLHVRGGEFMADEAESIMDDPQLVDAACAEIVVHTSQRSAVLIFAAGIKHGQHVIRCLAQNHGIECGFITGDTPTKERDAILASFQRMELKYLCNVSMLTTGYDAPHIDCVAILRPTMSPGLLIQMVGRGFRMHPAKRDCLAEGQLVLTDEGLVPIEEVTRDMCVWDGEQFVAHHGAVCCGEQEVIEYAGLTATPDHPVWTAAGWTTFEQCASQQVPISVTGDGGQAIREAARRFRGGDSSRSPSSSAFTHALYVVRDRIAQALRQPRSNDGRVQAMRSTAVGTEMACKSGGKRQRSLHEYLQLEVFRLRRTWNRVSFCVSNGNGRVGAGESRFAPELAIGPDRQRWALRIRQSAICESLRESTQHPPTKTRCRVWDILNAGPLHRFTCEGLLVSNCLILDYGGNIVRHGPVDQISAKAKTGGSGTPPAKECPECHELVAAGYANCPCCGYAFPPPDRQKHEPEASTAGVLSGQITNTEYEVRDTWYRVHTKRGAGEDVPKTMRVDYRLGLDHWQSEFICLEHTGFARSKAVAWWKLRSPDPVPDTAERAVEIAEGGGLARSLSVTVRSIAGEKYDRIVAHELGPIPEPILVANSALDGNEVPF